MAAWLVRVGLVLGMVGALVGCGGSGGEVPPPPPPPPPPPVRAADPSTAPLGARELRNTEAFLALASQVRFFHPSQEVESATWKVLLAEGVALVLPARDDAELVGHLQSFFRDLAPTVQVWTGVAPDLHPGLTRTPSATSLCQWRHIGYGFDPGVTNPPYKNTRQSKELPAQGLPVGGVDPARPWEGDLVPGIRCRIPVALYSRGLATLPTGGPSQFQGARAFGYEDRPTRVAALGYAWWALAVFYPYWEEVALDWEAQRGPFLREAATTQGSLQELLQRFTALLKDGHARVGYPEGMVPPLVLDWVEDQWVVARVLPGAPQGLQAGDALLTVDGKDVDQLWRPLAARMSGSLQWLRARARSELLLQPRSRTLRLGLRRIDGTLVELDVDCQTRFSGSQPVEPRPAQPIVERAPGLIYFDADRATPEDFRDWQVRLQQAKALVVDLRGYVNGGHQNMLSYLLPETIPFPFLAPSPWSPGQRTYPWWDLGWNFWTSGPAWNAKVAVLTDGRALSAAETSLMPYQAFPTRFAIFGGPSGGADGYVTLTALPGGATFTWTGGKVTCPRGERLHALGIQPTHPVARTRAGIAAGRDEVLEKALGWLGY